jgi:isopentenyldiphosphate isomerase
MKKYNHGLACVVVNPEGKVLLLKRSLDKKLFPNKWFVVGAYPMSENDDFVGKVHSELGEETGSDGKILKVGSIVNSKDGSTTIIVHTFLAERNTDKVKINGEHTEFKWVEPEDIKKFDTVPGTDEMVVELLKQ